jgi:hypothetical protein
MPSMLASSSSRSGVLRTLISAAVSLRSPGITAIRT